MEIIKRKFCIENVRSRFGGKLPCIDFNDGYGKDKNYNLENDEYCDYESLPYDFVLCSSNTSDSKLINYSNKLYNIKDNIASEIKYITYYYGNTSACTTNVNEIANNDTVSAITTNYVLHHKDMIHYYKTLIDTIISSKYYKICSNEWIEITDEMWEENFSGNSGSECYKEIKGSGFTDEIKKFFYYDNLLFLNNLPYFDNYVIKNFKEEEEYYPLVDMIPKYYMYTTTLNPSGGTYYYKESGDTYNVYLTEEEYDSLDDSNYPSYVFCSGETEEECCVVNTLDEVSEDCVKWEVRTYDISGKTYNYKQLSNKIDKDTIACVNTNIDDFIKLFCDYKDFDYRDIDTFEINSSITVPTKYTDSYYYYETEDKNYLLIPKEERKFYEYYFLLLINYLYNNKKTPEERYLTDVIPHIKFPLYIEQAFDTIGMYKSCVKEWEAGKRFYVGDVVLYKNNYYKLGNDKLKLTIDNKIGLENSGFTFEKYLIKDYPLLSEFVAISKNNNLLNNNGYIYFPYYTGYYNKITHTVDFDEHEPSSSNGFSTNVWTHLSGETESESGELSALTPSNLSVFYRKFANNTDTDGNTVPFAFKKESSGETTELLYRIGVMNTYSGETILYDILSEVNLYSGDTKLSSYTDSTKTIDSEVITKDFPNANIIEFIYYLNCELDEYEKPTNGIKYSDKYYLDKGRYFCNCSGYTYSGETFLWDTYNIENNKDEETDNYLDINYDLVFELSSSNTQNDIGKIVKYISDDDNDKNGQFYQLKAGFDYLKLGESVYGYNSSNEALAKITINKDMLKKATIDCTLAKEYPLVGVFNINKNIEVNIARGSSTAIEKHNILSEINTFEDLENYRNNYFNL